MADIDLKTYDQINSRVDRSIMEYIRQNGLLSPNHSVESYDKLFSDFARKNPFDNMKSIQFGILYHQMKNLIEDLKAKISELESQKVLLENTIDPDSNIVSKIDSKIAGAQELLSTALARFEKYSKAKVGDKDVLMIVAEFKADCLADRFFSHVLGKSMMPRADLDSKYPNDMISKYEKYQELLGSVKKDEPGLKKYFDYMSFMRMKDEKARSNRYLIRMLEKEYKDSPILATPNYQKGKNTKLDMTRYRAYMDLICDFPMKEFEIEEFVNKSHIKEKNRSIEDSER